MHVVFSNSVGVEKIFEMLVLPRRGHEGVMVTNLTNYIFLILEVLQIKNDNN